MPVLIPAIMWIVGHSGAAADANDPNDPLSILGVSASLGAAPGYLDASVCGRCHADIAATFDDVGMAQAFRAPEHARPVEEFGIEYFHEPSNRYYRIDQDTQGQLSFIRFQRDRHGDPVNRIEIPIRWVIGSGNRARSYLYQTTFGEVFMLPISWYSEAGAWRMSPGFEHASHQGIGRQVTRSCLFCHNAYPEVPEGSDDTLAAQRFPQSLPEGIGCQRCHGPGAGHVRTVLEGGGLDRIRAAIVNPAKLDVAERDSVCFQCHLLPAETVEGVRRLGRGAYSFRPGELLSDYQVPIEASEEGTADASRFEINHHGYRLSQSACFQESNGRLACISCHDPHAKPDSATLRKTASDQCQDCHGHADGQHAGVSASVDCIRCHMPTRRTDDVIEVTMTDHRIARGPFDPVALSARKSKKWHATTDIRVFDPANSLDPADASLYASLAAVRANRLVADARARLASHLRENTAGPAEPVIEYARASIAAGDFVAAERAMRDLVDARPSSTAFAVLGMSLVAQGRPTSAVAAFSRSADLTPDPETDFNLAAAQLGRGDVAGATQSIDGAIEKRPLMGVAWKYRARILEASGDPEGALRACLRALQIEPADTAAYADVVRLYRKLDNNEAAERFLELGRRVSSRPQLLGDL